MIAKRNRDICALYERGLTLSAIGDIHGLTRERVRQIIGQHGLPERGNGHLTPKERDEIIEKIRSRNYSDGEIARQCGVTAATVGRYRHQLGIKALPENMPRNYGYTKRQRARAEALFRKGLTAKQAADAVGMTRDALLGQMFRARQKARRNGDQL